MATATEKLLTIEEFAQMPDPGHPTELVRGSIITLTPPQPLHGSICGEIGYWIKHFLKANDIGRIYTNDTGVVTERDPDTVRGADISYYSYARVPKDASRARYFSVAPDLVFEVTSPSDRTSRVLAKVAEYLNVGVLIVCVVDPRNSTVELFRSDEPSQTLRDTDTFAVTEILPGFSVPVRRFFE